MIKQTTAVTWLVVLTVVATADRGAAQQNHKHGLSKDAAAEVRFSIESVRDGKWSDPKTWEPALVPGAGDRVLIRRGTDVVYDVASDEVIRLVQVVGALRFARHCDTLLNVGILKVQDSDSCSESGFACDFHHANAVGEPGAAPTSKLPTLEIGAADNPIPADHSARIRLHYLPGMNADDAPAIACCSARMEIHGSPLGRTWLKLARNVQPGDATIETTEPVRGWRVGDEVIVTASKRGGRPRTFRDSDLAGTERRSIKQIDAKQITLDAPLKFAHSGAGDFRSEVANLSRNVVIESADPEGVHGHTVFHRFSRGGISYARFAHLGKKDVLGRYPIHFHLVGDTMRGSSVRGVAIVDSHNRWITIHGTEYLVVRDCVGYQSVGHGFFMEDGTEVFNLLDRNLGVQAYRGKRLPKQVLPFDPNDGAAFWWANGRNTLTRNVACENDQYGFRYDSQKRSNFDSNLLVRMPDGKIESVDIRTLPISRFSENESHSEGLYAMVFAGTEGVGPDRHHPHRLSNLKMWETHYALRSQLPKMLVENVKIDHAAYGIYRPRFESHVYRNLHIAHTTTEPFNRGLDDRSLQHGPIAVDGLVFSGLGYGGQMPLIQISANNATGSAASHFRNVQVMDRTRNDRWPLVNLGGGPRRNPETAKGVPVYVHDHYGPGQHAKVVSTRAKDLLSDGNDYRSDPPLTGDESVAAQVEDISFPKLLDPEDDLPPATVITFAAPVGDKFVVRGVAHDDGEVASVLVNDRAAKLTPSTAGVVDWEITLATKPEPQVISASSEDRAGNVEKTPHHVRLHRNPANN